MGKESQLFKVKVKSQIKLTGDIPKDVEGEIRRRLTMENPLWVENEQHDRWNGNTPQVLKFYEETDSGLLVPRGYLQKVSGYLSKQGVQHEIDDQTRVLPEVEFGFKGRLYRPP